MSGKTILVVGEDEARRSLNVFGLKCAGFSVDEARDTPTAVGRIAERCPDLLLLIAPHLDVATRCFVAALRDHACTREIPVVTLVEHDTGFDATAARGWGIDDHVVEPVDPHELIERVRAALHRRTGVGGVDSPIADLSLDEVQGVIRRGAREVPLGPTELRVLEFFLVHPGQVISRSVLLFRIWGRGPNQRSRIVDVNVCRVRRALEAIGCAGLLETVKRHGYRLRAPSRGATGSPRSGRNQRFPASHPRESRQ